MTPKDADKLTTTLQAAQQAHRCFLVANSCGERGDATGAASLAQMAADEVNFMIKRLTILGVRLPQNGEKESVVQLDTPDTREVLDLLTCAPVVAERVNESLWRNESGGLVLASDQGQWTELTESLSLLVLQVRRKVEGPKGKE